MVFNALSPIGERRADDRMAHLAYYFRQVMIEGEDDPPQSFRPQYPIYQDIDQPTETEDDIVNRQRREASQFA